MEPKSLTVQTNFIKNKIEKDLSEDKNLQIITRFPPEPNGYLHIGHAKAVCLNFGIAESYEGAYCNLRFDDTNPSKEEVEYVEAIKQDIKWLGFKWHEDIKFTSGYFDFLYESALNLVKQGFAYVCDLSPKETKQQRGTLTQGGQDSPYRTRTVEENLERFLKMKQGVYKEGECVLRAKIDMSSGNLNMRDPVIYRVLDHHHHQTKDDWFIYPMYDFAHCLSDAYENITHSLCTLEFQDHRPLYNWFIEKVNTPSRPQQIEFSRLELNYTITSKRKLKELIDTKKVCGWDDPRLPTLLGLRRRGYTSQSIRNFCDFVGVSKKETIIDMSILEECVRGDLNEKASRRMAVMNPLKVVITNYPGSYKETLSAPNHPQKEEMGRRQLPFSKTLFIEKDDYMENPPKNYFRLSEGKEVRLRYAYVIKCEKAIKDKETGEVIELQCTYDEKTLGKKPEGRKVKGIIHWLSEDNIQKSEIKLYDRLFSVPNPNQQENSYLEYLNPDSLMIHKESFVEKNIGHDSKETSFQFERLGYFTLDKESSHSHLVFNKTVSLKDSWKK